MSKYTEKEKEILIDSMLFIIKGHLMKCDAEDINIDKILKTAESWKLDGSPLTQNETGEYTYRISFKYKKDKEMNI